MPHGHRSPRRRRAAFIALALLAASILVGGTWLAAAVFQSPEQRAASVSPPPPAPVFAPVTTGSLSEDSTHTGSVAPGQQHEYTFPPGAEGTRSVVTGRTASVGSTLAAGGVITEVNGRPVFAVRSAFDLYRDIGFGDEGPDVNALQDTLVQRGLLDHTDGQFGEQTAAAVRALYEEAGYSVPTRLRAPDPAAPPSPAQPAPGDESRGGDDAPKASSTAPIVDAYLPSSEALGVATLPAQVLAAPSVGTHVAAEGAADLTIGTTDVAARIESPGLVSRGIAEGDPASVTIDGTEHKGRVTHIEPAPADSQSGPASDTVSVSFDDPGSVPAEALGQNATIRITTDVVATDTLIVPTHAVVGRGGDDAVVVKKSADGSLVEVPVRIVGSLRGMTGVTPVDSGSLAEGDEVRVG